ncbi:stress response protein nst1-like [Penaeus japonicus]|uniref:stress response protein nst1-like n=1 Tax=Penaeus japonicus TaxID=27405 RepID=UPI001C70CF52|nr:stress response protein nst1-like [Penaeus japonicus]
MATRITKWTRERGGRKDFADPTRKSHKPLKIHLSEFETKKLRELATAEEREEERRNEERTYVGKEESVMRKRIEKLRAELHGFGLDEKQSGPASEKGGRGGEGESESKGGQPKKKTAEELQREAAERKKVLNRVRRYIPPKVVPTTPKERSRTIHAKMLQERAVQMKEKKNRIRERKENEDKWGEIVKVNHENYQDDLWREKFSKIENRDRLKDDLDKLCAERRARDAAEEEERVRMRQNIEGSDLVHHQYRIHMHNKAEEEKQRKRDAALREIDAIRRYKLSEAAQEDQLRDEDLRYSAFRRAYARRVKQRVLDKMQGKRPAPVEDLEEAAAAAAAMDKNFMELYLQQFSTCNNIAS